ncbi:MAG: hypothetical protein DRJ47_10095 [Thermoprotei archaeon]|nr:MAG: hypothetical protein DRJ47_10095 [Thermoprotei archaeon]
MKLRLPDKRTRIQLVLRTRPKLRIFVRKEPVTARRPTAAQAQCRLRFGELSKAARNYSHEEVARMVGGEVVVVNGKKAIRMPDGRILLKHQAFIKAMMTGWKSPDTRIHLPKWMQELSRVYFRIPGYTIKKYKMVEKEVYKR